MKPGTKPKPTHLKLVTGNPGKRSPNRKEAKTKAGSSFDIKAFHKKALNLGGLPLDTLRYALSL